MDFNEAEVFSFLVDTCGNTIYRLKNDQYWLVLKEKNKKQKRFLGNLIQKDKLFVARRNSSEHLHIKSNSFGFCYLLLKFTKAFNKVRLIVDEVQQYEIPNEVIMNDGKFMHFKSSILNESFEQQLFLPLSIINNYLINGNGI